MEAGRVGGWEEGNNGEATVSLLDRRSAWWRRAKTLPLKGTFEAFVRLPLVGGEISPSSEK